MIRLAIDVRVIKKKNKARPFYEKNATAFIPSIGADFRRNSRFGIEITST